MSGPIAPLDPTTPKIPDELWKASGIPATGWVVRGWVALILIIAGWILADVTGSVYLWALAIVGVAVFFAMPLLVESLVLARLAAKVDAVELERNADKGHAVLEQLRSNTTAKMLAPHGWLRVQEGRVHLAVGDGRAAAKAFAEAERVSTHADKHELTSAQAHALVLAGDRKEARELLAQLRKRDQLSDLDHLNYGVVLLSEAGHNQEALGHLQQAREAFGDHPRALAGVVLALQRCDKVDEAAALLREAEDAVEASGDAIAQELLKRAKKGLRPLLEAKRKRERKSEKRVEPTEAASPDAQRKPKGKKGRKQSRRDARKKAKTEARHGAASDETLVDREHEESVEHDDATEAEAAVEQAAPEPAKIEARVEPEAPPVAVEEEPPASVIEQSEPASPIAEAIERPSEPVNERPIEPVIERASEPVIEHAEASEPVIEHAEAIEPPSEPVLERAEPIEPPRAEPVAESLIETIAPEPTPEPEEPVAPEKIDPPPSASSSTRAKPKRKDDEDDDIDLATLALEALGSGTRRKLDESEGGPSASGLRPIEPSASSGSLFRSALFDEPKPSASASSSSPSLFSLPKFDSVPTFAPPPKPTRGPVLPSRPEKPAAEQPAPKPAEPPKPAVPSVTPPKLGAVPSAPSIPTPKPTPSVPSIVAPTPTAAAPKPPTPALDDGWGDLGELDPFAAPPPTPAVKDEPER